MQAISTGINAINMISKLARRGSGNKGGGKNGDVVRVHTEFVAGIQLSSGQGTLSLSDVALGSTDLTDMGLLFRFYRFLNVELHFPAPNWTTAVHLAVGFVSTPLATVPSFINSEARHLLLLSADQTVPGTLRIPNKSIHDLTKWFVTGADASDPTLDTQGTFFASAGSSSSELILLTVRCDVEFRQMLDPEVLALAFSDREEKIVQRTLKSSRKVERKVVEVDTKGKRCDTGAHCSCPHCCSDER
jgi:hypothetical protein